jgi:hypothetical protein
VLNRQRVQQTPLRLAPKKLKPINLRLQPRTGATHKPQEAQTLVPLRIDIRTNDPQSASRAQLSLSQAERVSLVKTWSSNLQNEIALAGLASKIVVSARATAGRPQTCDHFIVYPATGALEIASAYRHEAAEALQRVVRSMEASFYFELCCLDRRELTLEVSNIVLRVHSQFCSYFDKLIGV